MTGIPNGGVLAPVLTPFAADLSPDSVRFLELCRRLAALGLGLAPFGTTGEGTSLSADERIDLIDRMAEGGIAMNTVMAGAGFPALPDSVRVARHAVRRGCGGVLLLPPYYYKGVTDEGVFASYAEIIERVGDAGLRVYIYHFPRLSGVTVSIDVIERLLARYRGIVAGIKDSSGDLANMVAMASAFPGFAVFTGSETLLLDLMRGGGAGCISSNANVNGPALLALARGWNGPDAETMQESVGAFRRAIHPFPPSAALKALMALRTGDEGWRILRPPLAPLSAEDEKQLWAALGEVD